MRTFSIYTLGCKVNQYESQQTRQLLEELGLREHDPTHTHMLKAEKPDLIIINTCCVTRNASSKSRQYIRKAEKLNPTASIVVIGCLPTVPTDELKHIANDNIYVIKHRQRTAATLIEIVSDKRIKLASQHHHSCQDSTIKAENHSKSKDKKPPTPPKLPLLTSFKGQTRAFLKVQDGCDGYCSYCIIPKTRPNVHSKPTETVLAEAAAFVESGHKEIVVTGIFLGSLGQGTVRRKNWPNSQNNNLANLLEKLAQIPNLERIRLSSLEPLDVTERLLDVFCNNDNIMPHLHLSLQSGSNSILKKMCRQYNIEDFVKTIDLVKSRLDRPAITTDLIVGFPGETEDDFQQTVYLAQKICFAKMHIFSFSARKGTSAAIMQPVVNNDVIKKRSKILHDLDIELGRKFRQQFIGQEVAVLLENSNGKSTGRCERYFTVQLEKISLECEKKPIVSAMLVKNTSDGAVGRVIR